MVIRQRLKWLIPLVLVVLITAVYLYPVPQKSFAEIYAEAPPEATTALVAFRENHPRQTVEVDGITWEYVALGEGTETVVFLHGMTGAYDIWWAQMEAMAPDHQVISTTYPPVTSLAAMGDGVLAILDQEGVEKANLVDSSLWDALKATYPTVTVQTLQDVGHFPYINEAETYTGLLQEFFEFGGGKWKRFIHRRL